MQIEAYRRDVLPRLPADDFVLESDGVSVRNFWRMQEHAPYFRDLMQRDDFRDLAAALVGSEPESLGVETFYKPARVGSAVPDHQDNAYFCHTPPDVFTLWIAIDPVTKENGAVEYLLGSHNDLKKHHYSGVKGNSFRLADDVPTGQFDVVQPALEPGDALAHHCQIIHRSAPNESASARRSLIIVYRGEHTRIDSELLAAYQTARDAAEKL